MPETASPRRGVPDLGGEQGPAHALATDRPRRGRSRDHVTRGIGDPRLDERDAAGRAYDVGSHRERGICFRRADDLIREVEGRASVAGLERAVHREVHCGVEHHAVHAAVHAADGIARELGGGPRRFDEPLAVAVEVQPELGEERHSTVAE